MNFTLVEMEVAEKLEQSRISVKKFHPQADNHLVIDLLDKHNNNVDVVVEEIYRRTRCTWRRVAMICKQRREASF